MTDLETTPDFAARLAARIAEAPARVEYVDPHPGKLGSDRVWDDCAFCSGSGVYYGKSGARWVRLGVENKWCFRCEGAGGRDVLVSSIRSRHRRIVASQNAIADEWVASARGVVLAELAEEAAEARREAEAAETLARLEAELETMPEAGAKLAGISARVERFSTFETTSYTGGRETKAVVKLVDDAGQTYSWITGSVSAWDFQTAGMPVEIARATVKRSKIYRDTVEIELSRPKLVARDLVPA